jgi:RNA polymerase sigma-70 factor, ECF subfamily
MPREPDVSSLDAIIKAAVAAWPDVHVPPEEFRAFLLARGSAADRSTEVLHANDLYLACACLGGDAAAWRELDRLHLARIPRFVAKIDRSPEFADDVRQRIAEKLLHDANGRPKLALYTGEGPIGAWIRVAAVREAQNAKAAVRYTEQPDERFAAAGPDAEEVLAKRHYADAFRRAFEEVVDTLALDRRNVLRLHYLDGLTLDEVAKLYQVSRSTAARWIAEVRQDLLARVKGALSAELGHLAGGPVSVFALIESQLDLSIQRHFSSLASDEDDPDGDVDPVRDR